MWSLDKLKAKLEAISNLGYNLDDIRSKTLTEAAILVPIIIKDGTPYILLTVRSMNLTNYPGQVSFPGGKRDKVDVSIVATALRETQEEIGMSSEHLKILGTSLPYVTQTNFLVTPVVAEVLNYKTFIPRLNPFEVCEILTVPLETFVLKKYHKCKEFAFGKDGEMKANVDFFEFGESNESVHIIWGLTALIATHVASLLFEKSPEFRYQDWLSNTNRKIQRDKIYDKLISRSKL
jgi:8-oxo-dGTP pyrophosphatase MutT (NUDIX family)